MIHKKTLHHKWFLKINPDEVFYDARLYRESWLDIALNDFIIFNYKNSSITCRVIGLLFYDSFSEAHQECGKKLIPFDTEIPDIIYKKIYGDALDYNQVLVMKLVVVNSDKRLGRSI